MLRIFRSIAAVFFGYATIALGATVFQTLLFGGITYWDSRWPDLVVGGGLTALSAVAGGYVLAVVAPLRPMQHTIPLVLWLSLETTVIYLTDITAGPLWFDIVSGSSLVGGVLIGAFAYTRLGSRSMRRDETKPPDS